MPDRDLPGETDQEVEPERGDAEIADLDQEVEAILAHGERRQAQERDPDATEGKRGLRRKDRLIRSVGGLEIAARAQSRGGHDR